MKSIRFLLNFVVGLVLLVGSSQAWASFAPAFYVGQVATETADANSGALTNHFDREKVEKDLALQVKVTKAFSENIQFEEDSGRFAGRGGEGKKGRKDAAFQYALTGEVSLHDLVTAGVIGAAFAYPAAREGTATGTVFDSIKATQPVYPGSVIPKSFELTLPNGQRVWVAGNATEHMAEFAQMKAINYTPEAVKLASQTQLSSLQAAVNTATQNGIPYNQLINVGGWELKFAPPRQVGQLPAVIHALPRP